MVIQPATLHINKDAANLSDPNPVDATHVLNMMEANFPDPAIDWVRRTSWIGPVQIPWDRINDDSVDSWAASHQPGRVNEFVRRLRSKTDKVNPSICIQGHNGDKVDIVDGHHRALAHKKLGQPVLAYVGTVKNPEDVKAALETHAMQYHAGSDPKNKRAKVTKESVDYRRSESSERCGNCAMFDAGTGSCDVVLGRIDPQDVCQRWLPGNSEKSAETPRLSVEHHPIGHEGVWHSKHPPLQLPAYIQNVRNALMRAGHDESSAHAMAIAAVRRWASGEGAWGHKGKVTPVVREAAQRAVQEFEELRRNHP